MTQTNDTNLRHKLKHVEDLVRKIDGIADPAVRAYVSEVVRTILDFHGTAMARVVDGLARRGEAGDAIVREFAQDELVASVLLLYDLHPLDMPARVREALTKLEPELRKHGLAAELAGVEGSTVRARLTGKVHGCHSSVPAVTQTIQDAIYAMAPEAESVEVEDATAGADGKQFVTLTASASVHAAPQDAPA